MKLKNVLADLKVYGKSYLRAKSSLFFVFVFPAIIILIFGSIFSGGGFGSGSGSSTVPLYIQNMDNNSTISEQFISAINSSHLVKIVYISENVNIRDYVSQNSVTAALVIPSGFSSSYINRSPVNISFYYNPADSASTVVLNVVQNIEYNFNSNFTASSGPIHLNTASVSVKADNYADYLIPGLIGFVILTSPMFSMTYVVSAYKKDKIFRQLSLTPLTKSEWFTSKFLWYLIVSLISAGEIIAIGYFAFNSRITFTILMIPFILLGVFLFTCLGVFAGAISRTEEGASVIGNIITFPMMFLAGTFFPVSVMPSYLQAVAHVLPLYYIIDGLNSVMVYSNYSAAFIDVLVSIVVAAIIFAATYAVFNWKEEKFSTSRKNGHETDSKGETENS